MVRDTKLLLHPYPHAMFRFDTASSTLHLRLPVQELRRFKWTIVISVCGILSILTGLVKLKSRNREESFLRTTEVQLLDANTIYPLPCRLNHTADCGEAMSQSVDHSEGYMEEPITQWVLREHRQIHLMKAQCKLMQACFNLEWGQQSCLPRCGYKDKLCAAQVFWQVHYEPSFSCVAEQRVGNVGEGGKWICDPFRLLEKEGRGESCLVYSIGSNGQYDFEEGVHSQVSSSCEIHTIDRNNWTTYTNQPPPDYVNFHVYRVGNPPKGTQVSTIMNALGHSKRVIDIFKIDCEGCEWTTFESWITSGVYIRQILIEVHPPQNSGDKWDDVHRFFWFLFKLGYVIFHKEPNTLGCLGQCIEYAFVKMSPQFAGANLC